MSELCPICGYEYSVRALNPLGLCPAYECALPPLDEDEREEMKAQQQETTVGKSNRRKCFKVGYATKAQARGALNDFGKDRGSTRAYKCPYHQGKELWHLTSEK